MMNLKIEMMIREIVNATVQTVGNGFMIMIAPFALMPWIIPIILIVFSIILFVGIPFVSQVLAAPYRLGMRILRLMGVLHEKRNWGVVYDSVNKQPIDPAYVSVLDRWGKVIATAVTDLDGRFGIIIPKGTYRLKVEKTNYEFPSKKLNGKETDGYYSNLYFGGAIQVLGNEQSLVYAVPIDPVGEDWNQSEKKRRNVSLDTYRRIENKYAAYGYYSVAGILIGCRYLATGNGEVVPFLIWYGIIFIIGFVAHLIQPRSNQYSVVFDSVHNIPLAFARIKIFRATSNIQVASKATSYNGQFVCLIPNGTYFITIEQRNNDGTFTLVNTSEPFDVFQGSVNRRFVF